MDKETLEKYEPVVYRLFLNSRKQDRLSSGYLLYGPKNAPLKEVALYLAESLNCEKDYLACKNCPSCRRFEEGVRPDFVFLDGEQNTIKKGDIQALENKFSLSALEKGHRLVYILHHVENITEEAANSLLKFLEEPKFGQVALLTTDNPTKVLSTIRSRSLSVPLSPIEPRKFEKTLLDTEFESGKKKMHLSQQEAYYLSENYSSMDDVKALLEEDNSFRDGFSIAEDFLNSYVSDYEEASYNLLSQYAQSRDSKCYNWIIQVLHFVFRLALLDEAEDNPFSDLIAELRKKKDALRRGESVLEDALANKALNFNPTLLLSRFLVAVDDERK